MNLKNVKFLLFAFLNNTGIGAYMVLVAWTAAGLSNGLGEVGRVFMAASMVTIFIGPFIGNYVDNNEKRLSLLFSQLVKVGTAFLPILSLAIFGAVSEYLLYLIVALIASSSSMSAVAINYLVKSSFDEEGVKNSISLISIFREGGVVLGSVAGGLLIYHMSFESSFLVILLISFGLTIPLALMMPKQENSEISKYRKISLFNHARQFSVVLRNMEATRFVLIIIVMTGLAAFMNTLLPEYIAQLDYGNSKLYGNVEAFWSLGGVCAGALIVKLPNRILTSHYNPSVLLVGFFTLIIPFAFNSTLLAGVHFVIGAIFSYGFISAQNYLTQHSQNGSLGKHLGIANSIGSICGLSIYLLPSIIEYNSLTFAYLLGGAAIMALGVVLLVLSTISQLNLKSAQT